MIVRFFQGERYVLKAVYPRAEMKALVNNYRKKNLGNNVGLKISKGTVFDR